MESLFVMLFLVFGAPKSFFQNSAWLPSCRLRRTLVKSFGTRYTIDCPPTDTDYLENIVKKHVVNLDRYLQAKPMAAHTRQAYEQTMACIHPTEPLILDSGCGTGRSSLQLGCLFPNSTVVGIDRSIVRLDKNRNYQAQESNSLVQQATENVWLVRAKLVDFWHSLILQEQYHRVQEHYILYPNPYPKKSRIPSRWYAHPSFPLILKLGGSKIVLRSNWEQYLWEFAQAVEIADTLLSGDTINYARPYVASAKEGPVLRPSTAPAWTNFEAKYQEAGEPTYELILERQDIL